MTARRHTAVADPTLAAARAPRSSASTRSATRWSSGRDPLAKVEMVASECPVALVFNGVSHAVMMSTPADLEDMGIGFAIAEGIVGSAAEIAAVEVLDMVLGMEVRLEIPAARAAALDERRRSMVGGTACGLCGIISLDMAIRPLPKASAGLKVHSDAIRDALGRLPNLQATYRQTGAVHAAAMASPAGEILLICEDVGRHNALDKLVGAATRVGLDLGHSILLLTSRCSTEMIQKAATAGFTTVVAISAPTSLAIELAEDAGLTLVAFARGNDFTVYTGPERIAPQ